jgi:glycosyltransferase involved in cell wall biosynthesis
MITVVFATHNGSRTLAQVLEAYCRIITPAGGWKLIVVDNASTDRTPEIIMQYKDRLPITCLYEGTLGKNTALNAAIPHFDGDLIVFSDDDVFPQPTWLVSYRVVADAQPSHAVFGGVILPRWEVPAPGWILDWVPRDVIFALTNPTLNEGPTTPNKIFGPNMAVRSEVFKEGFRFNTAIGPRGASYAMGSETEFVRRLARNGYAAWHVQAAIVEHFIREYQMERSWILGRAVRYGRGQYRLNHTGPSTSSTVSWFGIPRHLFRQLLEQIVLMIVYIMKNDQEKYFLARWNLNFCRGSMLEAWSLRNDRKGVDLTT